MSLLPKLFHPFRPKKPPHPPGPSFRSKPQTAQKAAVPKPYKPPRPRAPHPPQSVASHTRRLKNGRTITVQGHRRNSSQQAIERYTAHSIAKTAAKAYKPKKINYKPKKI